jgi:hypothetical protein
MAACSSEPVAEDSKDVKDKGAATDPTNPVQGGFENSTAPAGAAAESGCTKMDIVFVVDNSGSMEQEQQNLTENFPKFVKIINDYRTKTGDKLDYRIAITTTDIDADKGTFQASGKSCSSGPNRAWLERGDADVEGAFACRAKVGTDGSGEEHPLEALKLAFTDRVTDGVNAGFLRDDALLAFVVLTDEDESAISSGSDPFGGIFGGGGSKTPLDLDAYVTAFDGVKKDRSRWAGSIIAGDKSCTSGLGSASEAVNLKSFTNKIGKNGTFSSICTGNLTIGLESALGGFDVACKEFKPGPK